MSETRMNIPEHNIAEQLVKINVPNLNDVNYATQLSQSFSNINTNFIKLSNRDFVKGEAGDSVKIVEMDLINPDRSFTFFGNKIIEAIENKYMHDENGKITDVLNDIEYSINNTDNTIKISWLDTFKKNPGKLYVIYDATAVEMDEDIAVSSLYYTFLDGRYSSQYTGRINANEYENLVDVSCIMVYDKNLNNGNGGFNILSNAFPTIYYENGIGLCWKVNGANTGIPVQGIPGKDGRNNLMTIVKSNISSNREGLITGNVTHIFEPYYGYKKIKEYNNVELLSYDDTSALILAPSINNEKNEFDTGFDFYFGSLKIKDIKDQENGNTVIERTLESVCTPSTNINGDISTESFINAMKHINISGTGQSISVPHGLYIPMDDETINETNNGIVKTQPVHLMSATPIVAGIEGAEGNIKSDLIFTPVNDCNNIEIDVNENKNIIVNKYLYLKLNNDDITVTEHKDRQNWSNFIENYNGILKYKLESNISNPGSSDFDIYNLNDKEAIGSRSFGENLLENEYFTKDKVRYINTLDNTVSNNHIDSMPVSFKERLNINDDNKIGIYKWTLCTDKNDYDIDELKKLNVDNYTFPANFKTIYTTDITPSTNTEFLWFDGYSFNDTLSYNLAKNDINDIEYIKQNYSNLYYNGYYPIVRGWYNGLFSFVKFVPIYTNSYAVDNDTSLNLNYNVNITGDDSNSKKSITVHGNINCDNLNVHNLIDSNEIKNIYTKNIITGDAGIKLGKSNLNGEYGFNVEDSGEVNLTSGLNVNLINAEEEYVEKSNINELNTINTNISESFNVKLNQTNESINENPIVKINKSDEHIILNKSLIANNKDFDPTLSEYYYKYFTIENLSDGKNVISFKNISTNSDYKAYIYVSYEEADGTQSEWRSYGIADDVQFNLWRKHQKLRIKGKLLNMVAGFHDGGLPTNTTKISTIDGLISNKQHSYISAEGNYKVYGNIMSILLDDYFLDVNCDLKHSNKNIIDPRNLIGFFKDSTQLIDAKNLVLPSNDFDDFCGYAYMFSGCENLESAPILYAKNTKFCCYYKMFENCKKLKDVTKYLPATDLYPYCYAYMFSGCETLEIAPEISAVYLNNSNTTDKGETGNDYYNSCKCIFENCKKLKYIKACAYPNTDNSYNFKDWINGVWLNDANFDKNEDNKNNFNLIIDKRGSYKELFDINDDWDKYINIIDIQDEKNYNSPYYINANDNINGNNIDLNIKVANKINIESPNIFNEIYENYKSNDNVPVISTDIPIFIKNSANIVVSNEKNENGIIYYKNLKRDININNNKLAGTGVDMTDSTFDSIKNFNINRLYAYDDISYTLYSQYKKNDDFFLNTDSSGRIKFYENKDVFHGSSYTVKSISIGSKSVNRKIDRLNYTSFWENSKKISNTSIYDELKRKSIASFSLDSLDNIPKDDIYKTDDYIKIKFNNIFSFNLALKSIISNPYNYGSYPMLYGSNNTNNVDEQNYLTFVTYIYWKNASTGTENYKAVGSNKYRFDSSFSTTSILNNVSNIDDSESNDCKYWWGFEDVDNTYSNYVNYGIGKSLKKANETNIRYRTLTLFPKTINISIKEISDIIFNKDNYDIKICTSLYNVNIRATNSINREIDFENKDHNKDVVSDIYLYSNFSPLSGGYYDSDKYYTSENSDGIICINGINPKDNPNNPYWTNDNEIYTSFNNAKSKQESVNNPYSYISTLDFNIYTINTTDKNIDSYNLNSTSICTNGIVSRSNKHVFGLGYSDFWIDHTKGESYNKNDVYYENTYDSKYVNTDGGEPVLFYYDHGKYQPPTEGQGDDANLLPNSKIGYATRVNTIRLSELFNTLQVLRTNDMTANLFSYGI